MVSTETNGDAMPDTTTSPDLFSSLKNPLLSRREQLPFHSPSKPSSLLQPSFQSSYPGSHRTTKSPSGWSDKMNSVKAMPARRASPQVRIPPAPRSAVLPYATSKTGLVYDPRMRFHAELPDMSINADDIHPEDPRRIHSIFEEIKQAGLVGSNTSEDDSKEDHCWRIGIRPATRPEILLIHTEEHYDFVESLQSEFITTSGKLTITWH